jgi:hypothetical protein
MRRLSFLLALFAPVPAFAEESSDFDIVVAATQGSLDERIRAQLDPVFGTATCGYGFHQHAWDAATLFAARYAAETLKSGAYPVAEFVAALKGYVKKTSKLPSLPDKEEEAEMRGEFSAHLVNFVQLIVDRTARLKPPIKTAEEMVARVGDLRRLRLVNSEQRAFFSKLVSPVNGFRKLALRYKLKCDESFLAGLPRRQFYESGPESAGEFLRRLSSIDAKQAEDMGRVRESDAKIDACEKDEKGNSPKSFAASIERAVSDHLEIETKDAEGKSLSLVMMGNIGAEFKLPSPGVPVSLASHPMCAVTGTSLDATLRNDSSPEAVYFADSFAQKYNHIRAQMRAGEPHSRRAMEKLWGRFFGCLAYQESLTTADTKGSISIAGKFGVEVKPSGVKFYFDPWQSEPLSQFNVGLFQFSANVSGNLYPCVQSWNARMKDAACKVTSKDPVRNAAKQLLIQKDLIPLLASPRQAFSTYCGANKIAQTFFLQVNTSSAKRTHSRNLVNDKLVAPAERCVSLHIKDAYAHFGPLINTTGDNLVELMRCAAGD